jgi:hypothetical protein
MRIASGHPAHGQKQLTRQGFERSQEVQAELDRKKHEYQLRMRKVRAVSLRPPAQPARVTRPIRCAVRERRCRSRRWSGAAHGA